MKIQVRNIATMLGWLLVGLVCVPGIQWVIEVSVRSGFAGLNILDLPAAYLDFYSRLNHVLGWIWIPLPYVLFFLYRLSRSKPGHVSEPSGCTPLGLAAFKGDLAGIRLLLRKGTDINQVDKVGRTPLHLAVLNRQVEMVRALLDAGADVDAMDSKLGFRPLHLAARQGDADTSEMLVRYGADIDAQSRPGETALHLAVINGFPAVVAVLLKYLARLEVRDGEGKTALQYAQENGNTEIAGLIQAHISETWAYLRLSNG